MGTQIEIGSVDPFGLLAAQLEGLVRASVWVLYPAGLTRGEIRQAKTLPASIAGYEFHIHDEADVVD